MVALLAAGLLGACGATPSPTSTTATPGTGAASLRGDFVALLPDGHTRVAFSTDGRDLIAYACDGDDSHPLTFATWFRDSVSDNAVDLSSTNENRLQVTLIL